jgi:molecular chaperone DnaJ
VAATKRDYYEILQVTKTATEDEIKRSYRKLAMKYHPDRNPGDHSAEVQFKECAEAYEVLSDQQKRQRYDQYGHQGVQGQAHDFSGMDVGDIFSMFNDIFGGFGGDPRGGQRGGNRPSRGFDLETQVELSLSEVALGAEKTIEFEKQEICETCDGSGAKKGSGPVTCPACGGQGRVAQQGFGGMFRMVTTCPNCRGRGQVIKDKCPACSGVGRVAKKRVVTVRIPAGVHEGQAVRISGEGEPGENGGPAGDLHCYITVKQHPMFTRHGNDIVCQEPISFTQAALGAEIEVPTLKGSDTIDVPAGTQHGEVFKIKGKGLPDVRSHRSGDEIVQVVIEIPKKLTEAQKQLLRDFAETEDNEVMPQKKSFWGKLKEAVKGD